MKFGVCLPNNWGVEDIQSIFLLAIRAKELAFDSVWVSEHIFAEGRAGNHRWLSSLPPASSPCIRRSTAPALGLSKAKGGSGQALRSARGRLVEGKCSRDGDETTAGEVAIGRCGQPPAIYLLSAPGQLNPRGQGLDTAKGGAPLQRARRHPPVGVVMVRLGPRSAGVGRVT